MPDSLGEIQAKKVRWVIKKIKYGMNYDDDVEGGLVEWQAPWQW